MLEIRSEAGTQDCNLQNGMKSAINKRKLLAAAIYDLFRLYNTCGFY